MSQNTARIVEEMSQPTFEVNREDGLIRDVKLCGAESKNDRIYTDAALNDLQRLYERKPIRIGHDEKSYLSTVGSIIETRYNRIKGEVRGDVSLNRAHPAYGQIMEDAENRPHLLKLSHEIPARGYTASRRGDTLVVDRVHRVDCLAIVTDGGVNSSLFESVTEDEEMELKTVAELKEKFPALYEEVTAQASQSNSEKLIEALQQRDEARAKLNEAVAELTGIKEAAALEERKAAILKQAGELKVACSEELLEALIPLSDEKVTKILGNCPKIKEDGSESEESQEKPRQRSGLSKKLPVGYESPADWIKKYSLNS